MDSSDRQIGNAEAYTGISTALYLVLKVDLLNDTYRVVSFKHESDKNEEAVCLKDVYRVVDLEPDVVFSFPESGKYSEWLDYFGDNCVHEDDDYDYHRNLNLKALKKLCAADKRLGYWVRFDVKIDEGAYCPCSFEILANEDFSPDNPSIYIVIKKLDRELDGRISIMEEIFRSMGDTFTSIYYIDFTTNRVIPYRLSSEMSDENQGMMACFLSYEAVVNSSLINIVAKKHQERILNILDKENLKRRIATEGTFSIDFPANYGGRDCYLRLRAANISKSKEIERVAIGISDITVDKLEYDNFYKIGRSVLVVEDNEINREILCSIIEEEYHLFEAENGAEALSILEDNYEDIAAVITDLEMPVMNGYELLEQMSKIGKYNSIPIIITTASDDVETEVACLSLGASDFITKPYNAEVVKNRLKSLVRLKESTAMLNTLAKDSLTGLYTREFFFKLAEDILKHSNIEEYQVFCVHIENLKMINEKYGSKGGDEVLVYVAKNLKDVIPGYDIGGVLSGSTFAALGRKCEESELRDCLMRLRKNAPIVNLSVKCGFCSIDSDISMSSICDRAILATENISGSYGVMIAEYDDILRQNMAKQQQIVDNMEEALVKHQFCVYYQPKHDIKNDVTGGAEALVRWIHPEMGFMNPGLFISLFEQNGFITKLDRYIFEEVCSNLREWIDKGKRIVPISINVSRRDFECEDLADFIISMADKYRIPHEFLHIEVTESAYSDNPGLITRTIDKLHDSGFIIELDDFGAGYSSLSTLSNMHIDVMKLDMSLIRNDHPGEGKDVLQFAIYLAKMTNMKTVAEGVETLSQKERLEHLGCDYIQGYYYSKPIPKDKFEEYLEKNA